MSTTPFTLYHYWRSSCSWRVRWALAIKGQTYLAKHVNIVENEQFAPDYKAISPLGVVPTLLIDERALTESVAICEYLDEVFSQHPLRPADPLERARMRQLVEIINAGTQPLQNLFLLRKLGEREAQVAWATEMIHRGLQAFESTLALARKEGTSGPFCMGKTVTLADLVLVPQLYNARRFHVDLSAYPLALAAESAALATDACKAAHPDIWAPPGFKP